jgi:bisphosphoglycerate-independent phosphoglycerate mutase (AlkP superfamily)
VAETVVKEKYPFVMCNFAPPDMVGHVRTPVVSILLLGF